MIHNERVKLWSLFCMSIAYVVGTALVLALAAAVVNLWPTENGSAWDIKQIGALAGLLSAGAAGFYGIGWRTLRKLRA